MKHYRPSSELHRAAEQVARNEERLALWRAKYAALVAASLRRVGAGITTTTDAAILAAAIEEAINCDSCSTS